MAAVDGGIVRSAEWRRVREFAVEARAHPAVLVLAGEAGAGKSTLWRAGLQAAVGAGRRLLRSEPSASETDLSFAGLSDLLADVLPMVATDIPDPQLRALEVALVLRAAGDEPPTPHAIGLAVLAALRACASRGPVLLAVDDVQWLDEASLDALAFALRRFDDGPLSVLLGARTHAPADPLTAGVPPPPDRWRELLATGPAAQLIELTALDVRQIQNLLPGTMSGAQARLVAAQSRGNPFWAMEISASLARAETPVPALARTLTDRLSRSLSTEAADALAVVAAAGRIQVADALAVLADHDDPAAALDAAVVARVVVEAGGRVAVTHPLIGAAAVEALPPGRRAELYRRLAAVSVTAGPERHAHFAALAAGRGPDADVATALDAAAAAAHGRAGNAAASQFAVQAVTFTADSDCDTLSVRRIRAAELLFLAGQLEDAMGQLAALNVDLLPTELLERALPLLLDTTELVRGAPAAIEIVRHAVDCAGTEPRRRALVLALASDIAYGIPRGRRAAAVEAISCAEVAGPSATPAMHRALLYLAVAKVTSGEGLDSELLDRAEELESGLSGGRLHDSADVFRGVWSRFVDDLPTARASLRRSVVRAREASDDFALTTFLSYLAATEELAGDYAAAATLIAEAEQAEAWHDWPPSPWHLDPRCELRIAAGELDDAIRIADRYLPDDQGSSLPTRFVGAWVRGKVSLWRGDFAAARRHLELGAWCADECEWTDPGVRSRVDPLLAEACAAGGHSDQARRIAAWLRESGARLGRPSLLADADRIDALLAAQAGDLDHAANLARAAAAGHEVAQLRVEHARSLLVLGRVERRRKARKESRAALSEARQMATTIGHRPLLAEIEAELPRIEAARAGTELTTTEARVAELICDGSSNREAAAALFVSVRTVETHVASIYRKLGIRTRAELVRRLAGRYGG